MRTVRQVDLAYGLAAVFIVSLSWASQLSAQAPASAGNVSANATPAIVLPRELALEEQLQVATDQRDQALNRVEALQVQADSLLATVNQFLGQMQAERNQKGNESREAIGRKLIAAVGCDWEKRDRWDWNRRGCVKSDGTFVPLEKK